MDEPVNQYDVGLYRGSVAFGKGVHRLVTQKQALELAFHLIKSCEADTPQVHEALSRILNLLVMRARPAGEDER